jgi:Fe-S-cluster-containing dehydrogenase component
MSAHFRDYFIDFQRCIGCNACAAACAECHTHRGTPMIQIDKVDELHGPQTVPMVCLHCTVPTCAMSCPADAIKMEENGIVHSSQAPRCIACRNCEFSCPFGVPMIDDRIQQMQKCDMCYDRTSGGRKPMCCAVCPTGALYYGTADVVASLRPHSTAIRRWRFGNQAIETRVYVMVPHNVEELVIDWPAMLKRAPGPVELAADLRRYFEEMGLMPAAPPAMAETAAAMSGHPAREAEFL